jgi:predicted MPP superfamily phosphohydrolase
MFWKILCAVVVILGIYAIGVEPYWMKVTEHSIILERLRQPLRILFLSDTQLKGESGYREKWILQRVQGEKIDLVLTTGDLFETPEAMPAAIAFLDQLANLAPTYAVLGNWENWSNADLGSYRDSLTERGIPLLTNENRTVAAKDQTISILGVDDPGQNLHNLPRAKKGVPSISPQILLAHAPIIFPIAEKNQIDLVLAGHSHGGQIRIPFLDPPYLPPGCGPYFYGIYKKNGSTMVVTSGVGTSIFPIRFLCRPEIVFLNLKPAAGRNL